MYISVRYQIVSSYPGNRNTYKIIIFRKQKTKQNKYNVKKNWKQKKIIWRRSAAMVSIYMYVHRINIYLILIYRFCDCRGLVCIHFSSFLNNIFKLHLIYHSALHKSNHTQSILYTTVKCNIPTMYSLNFVFNIVKKSLYHGSIVNITKMFNYEI